MYAGMGREKRAGDSVVDRWIRQSPSHAHHKGGEVSLMCVGGREWAVGGGCRGGNTAASSYFNH